MNLVSILRAAVRSPLNLYKLVRLLLLMQKKQVEEINRLESVFFHPDYQCVIGGTSRISGTYDGWSDYRDRIILGEVQTPGKVRSITTGKDSITLSTHLTGHRDGKSLDLDVDFVFVFADHRISKQQSIPADNQQWSAFWE